jgi:hypothetical protein
MNTENTTSQDKSFLPLVLIACSLIVFFIFQLTGTSKTRDTLNTSRKQLEDQVNANMPNANTQVQKAEGVVEALKKLAGDLSDMSKTDDNAKTVVGNLDKVGIKFQPNGSAAPAPAPSSGTP